MRFIRLTAFLLCIQLVLSKDEKYVDISLDAKWQQTPIILEASEYVAEKSSADFWKFIEGIQKQKPFASDKESYDATLNTASSILSDTELDALKFSLSIRAYSPRVQFFQQVALDLHSDCKLFFQISDRSIYCNLNEAIENAQSYDSEAHIQTFDHVYPNSEENKHLIIVYADVISEQFGDVHTKIKSKMNELNLKYVLRHHYEVSSSSKVGLSGFGVELAVKSTEYTAVDDQKVADSKKKEKVVDEDSDEEVEGFLFKRLRKLHPSLVEQLDQLKSHLKESNQELVPLRVWQLQDLSFQASQRVVSASSQNVLKVLKDLSQNVPMVARSLVKTSVSDDMRNGIKSNQEEFQRIGINPGEAAMFINGIELSVNELDVFKLLNIIKSETSTMSKLNEVDLEPEKIGSVLALNTRPDEEGLIVDMRSESVQWMNDLENDGRYSYWPSSLQEMLRPTFPGMLRYVARNIFHVVAYVDPMTKEGKDLFLSFNELVENSVPARFGIVFVVSGSPKDTADDNSGAALVRAFSFVKSDRGLSDAFGFLSALYRKTGSNMPSSKDVISLFTSWFGQSEADDNLGSDSEYDDLRRVSKQVFDSLGLKSLPNVLVNGQQLSPEELKSVESAATEKMLLQTPTIQQAIYMGHHYSYPNIYDYIMSQPNVVNRLNKIIQTLDKKFVNAVSYDGDLQDVTLLSKEQVVGVLMNQVKYFVQDKGVTIWIVANAETNDGKKLIRNALHFVQKQKNSRVAIILHDNDGIDSDMNWNDVLEIIFGLRQKLISGVAKLICKLLDQDSSVSEIIKEEQLLKLTAGITGINKKKLLELLSSTDTLKQAKLKIQKNSALVKKAFGMNDQDNVVMANGRLLGPLKGDNLFVVEDFELLQNFENSRCGYKIAELVEKMSLPKLPAEGHDRYRSDIVLKVSSIMSAREDHKRTTLSYKEDKHSVVHLPPPKNSISFDIEAVLDPLSKGAQKLAPILMVLQEAFNVNLRIFLNCKAKHSEMPVNRFYQYVLQPELTFEKNGKLLSDRSAIFTNLPHSVLLTLIMDTPINWMIEAVGSNQDLDNIHLSQANGVVYGDFELEHIIIEGHCSDSDSHQPPRGLQFVLGNDNDPEIFDTIVMANLGYFQLKAFPGAFVLQLREGRSSQIYQIDSLEGGQALSSGQNYTIIIDDFAGRFLRTKVKRRPGQESADLLGGEGGSEGDFGGIWDSIASYVKREKSTKNTDGKIHIFSVATGLLYERFLRIMMLSVLNHTKTPVKFWFLKNYLSSGFTQFLPHYAKHYGFEYELVQYQWPKWLNGQTEKQRIIWGYKILFLDVLFPLNLERIIFVDADQIVRADLKELMDMDLDGAPYAYTPFCNDRPEVEGFRFWNHGYWRSHLAGRPYHISALYVVDLKRFRRIAAGDRLRGQYQGLSQDPNSLANLDQDLPNNMIHQVQIKSLPQDWLWCETWCSDESKERAKTIDMCNNPQTKEPKLERAMRIAPEWSVYDEIIRKLQENISNNITEVEPAALPIKIEL